MRPDLFASPALRDDSHRILARLANGGSVPAPIRQWTRWSAPRRARVIPVVVLLAICAAAWVLRESEDAPSSPVAEATARSAPAESAAVPPPSQAATIVNETPRPAPVAQASATVASAHPEQRLARSRAVRPSPVQSGPTRSPIAEDDEDVALLTAMLRHTNPRKAPPTPPKE